MVRWIALGLTAVLAAISACASDGAPTTAPTATTHTVPVTTAPPVTVGDATTEELELLEQAAADYVHDEELRADLLAIMRATAPYQDVAAAEAAGYERDGPCVPGAGQHYVDWDLVDDPAVELERPEVLMYEPVFRSWELIGVEYMVWADDADEAPEVLGGPMKGPLVIPEVDGPFYWLHVWLWKPNLYGLHPLSNPNVAC